jgi:hypothetical protein
MKEFAPVLIPTLNRFEHFKRCVESLSACTNADKTDLFVAFDYPLIENHWEGYRKIKDFLGEIQGFKSINIITRTENYGAIKNHLDAQSVIFEKYNRIIFSEDDNEFSTNFLDYINTGLNKFEDDPAVIAICGYAYPIRMPKDYIHNFYFFKAFSAWGFGAWKKKILNFSYNPNEIRGLIKNKGYRKASIENYKLANLYYLFLLDYHLEASHGDGAITISLLKDNKYCVFPTVSKTRNHGHDGSGIHCGLLNDQFFVNQEIDSDSKFSYFENPPLIDKNIKKKLRRYFGLNYKDQLRFFILCLKYFLKHGFIKRMS